MRSPRTALIALLTAFVLQQTADAQSLVLSLFERYLESLRQQAAIPGLSAVIVQNRRIAWKRGFGHQDIEDSILAAPDTPYPVADLSQTFAAVLLLQCVERGVVELDEPVRRWTDGIAESDVTVRHLLAHATPAVDGFRYDPSRYAVLTPVVERCGDRPYPKALANEVLDRLGMVDSVPGHNLGEASAASQLFDRATLDRYAAVLRRLATPYKVDRRGRPTRSDYPPKDIDASRGLISTVQDLANYDAGLDDLILLRANTLAASWTNARARGGAPLPSGLGWFVQTYKGERIVWHFGLSPGSFSSLILKVPGRDLTLILLANSDGLSASFSLADGDVTSSLFAKLFLELFV